MQPGDARDAVPDPGVIATVAPGEAGRELASALRRMDELASSPGLLAEEEFQPA